MGGACCYQSMRVGAWSSRGMALSNYRTRLSACVCTQAPHIVLRPGYSATGSTPPPPPPTHLCLTVSSIMPLGSPASG